MSIKLVELIDLESGKPVFVNPEYVTFVQPNISNNPGVIIGLLGDDLGCIVRGTVQEVANVISSQHTPRTLQNEIEVRGKSQAPKKKLKLKNKEIPHD